MNQIAQALPPQPPPLFWQHDLSSDLSQVELILEQSLESDNPLVGEVIAHVRHYRGKRLRPALLLLTARACGMIRPAHHILGAVVEMIHTATLVHDDILDGARMRRHVKTVSTLWGTHASVLLGDHLFTRAFHLASKPGDAFACEIIGESTNRVCEGELRQNLESGNLNLTEESYLEIIDAKTAELIACCCRLGSYTSGADEKTIEHLTRYGRFLGIAFQIADDILDLIGEEKTTGKSLGTDLQQQKMTLPLIHLLRSGTPAEQEKARALLQSADPTERRALLPMLKQSGSLKYARSQARSYAEQARDALDVLPSSPSKQTLIELTEQVIDRHC